jgi:TRAP-type C4-dicarboxylate transport system permease small subunit
MAQPSTEIARPTDPVGRGLFRLCNVLAVFGGLLCGAVAVLVTVSVTGRYFFDAPVPGDYDLVGIITGSAVFAFLPWCQMTRGNVVVDFFTTGVAPRGRAVLDGFGSLLYLVVAALFTWRLYYGMLELRDTAQVLAILNFYRWWTLPFDIFCVIVLIVTVAYTLVRDVADARTSRMHASKTDMGE